MRFLPKINSKRFRVIPETDQEKTLIQDNCIGVNVKSTPWTLEDCLLNRVALNELLGTTLLYEIAGNVAGSGEPDVRLLPYQVRDLLRTYNLPCVLNANPMGYGKTVEALQWAKLRGYRNILVVCPKSVRTQWQDAFWEWFDPEVEIDITPKVLRAPVVITNYEQLIRSTIYQNRLWDCIIADEVHRVRNTDTKVSAALRTLRSRGRIGLTGTPIMNQPDDLWGICLFINPEFLGGSYWNFVDKYCKVKMDFYGKKIEGATEDPIRRAILKRTMDLFWIRNPQNLVGSQVFQNTVNLDMYPAQVKLYKDIKNLAIDELNKVGISIANAMVQLMTLQRLTANPCSFEAYKGTNIKFEWIQDMLADNPELKICVFSKFRRAIIALQQELGASTCTVIHGEVPSKQREASKLAFVNSATVRVLAGTIGAMSEGIDGLQACCHTVVFLDCAWNPEENNQAIARVARMGQKYNVNVYFLYCNKTIDQYVGKVTLSKMDNIKELIWRE